MSSPHSKSFATLSTKALEAFTNKHAVREEGLKISREVIRLSGNAIRAVHREEFTEATDLITKAANRLAETSTILKEYPEIYYAGFLSDARKEFSEAHITLALLSGQRLPQPEEISSEVAAYLKGLGDAVGEMRRFILDSLRKDDWSRCEEIMEVMDELYGLLVTMDFPEAVTGGLRNTTDMVRRTLERTRGDFTIALRQRGLEKKLAAWEHMVCPTSSQNLENTD